MFMVRHTLVDLAEMGSGNTALSPCFRSSCTVSYRDLNIAACADTSFENARSTSEVLRMTHLSWWGEAGDRVTQCQDYSFLPSGVN